MSSQKDDSLNPQPSPARALPRPPGPSGPGVLDREPHGLSRAGHGGRPCRRCARGLGCCGGGGDGHALWAAAQLAGAPGPQVEIAKWVYKGGCYYRCIQLVYGGLWTNIYIHIYNIIYITHIYIYVSNWWLGMRLVTLSKFPEWGIPCVCVCVYIYNWVN